jgi:hypothetical protein
VLLPRGHAYREREGVRRCGGRLARLRRRRGLPLVMDWNFWEVWWVQTGQTLCPNTRLTKCVSFFLEPVGNMGLRPYKVLFLKKFEHFSKLEKFIFAAHYYIDNN